MTRLEVRCCCHPQKLLGWLPVPMHEPRAGMVVTFLVGEGERYEWVQGRAVYVPAETITLPIETFSRVELYGEEFQALTSRGIETLRLGDTIRSLALKSEETPIETLRRIHGFEENRDLT